LSYGAIRSEIRQAMVKAGKEFTGKDSTLKMGYRCKVWMKKFLKMRVTEDRFSVPRHSDGSRFAPRKMDFIY
jgi:hypothetical protein